MSIVIFSKSTAVCLCLLNPRELLKYFNLSSDETLRFIKIFQIVCHNCLFFVNKKL
jgi:hypothetical protein